MAENAGDKLRSRGARTTANLNNLVESQATRNYSAPRSVLDPDSIDPASIHALQTAFVSLQKTHNEQAKKYQGLLQRSSIMHKTLVDLNYAGGEFDGMDDLYGEDDTNMAHAAGATGGEITPENRAKQGYVAHLEREVMRGTWALSKTNAQYEKARLELLREKDRLQIELETIRESLQQKMEILHDRDTEIAEMKIQIASLKAEITSRPSTNEENITLHEQVEKYARSGGIVNNSSELKDANSRLLQVQKEYQKVYSEYIEKDKQIKEREKQVMALEAKCQQFQIEVDIVKNNRAAAANDALDTDGDIAKLNHALELIYTQRSVIAGLRQQVEVQGCQIQQMCSHNRIVGVNASDKLTEVRGDAQGASLCPQFREQGAPVYMNVASPGHFSHSPSPQDLAQLCEVRSSPHEDETDSPKEEDLFDVRQEISNSSACNTGMLPQMPVSRRSDPSLNIIGNVCSPRINDAIMPTGNVKTMMATEMSQQVQKVSANTIDCRTSPQAMSQSMYSPSTVNVSDAHNLPTYRQRDMRSSLSPSGGHGQRSSHVQLTLAAPTDNGARQKTTNFKGYENTSLRPGNIAPVMTQSEIVYPHDRNEADDEGVITRSVLEPLQPLIITPEHVTRPELKYRQFSSPARQPAAYDDDVPNYENIYTACQETEMKRPLVDDDTVFVTPSDLLADQTQTNRYENVATMSDRTRPVLHGQQEQWLASVSDLKICPVCNQEFSRLTMDQFQTHVFECFDNCEEAPPTLLAHDNSPPPDDERVCPMCGDGFPMTIPQETFEVHVLGHFGEQPVGYEIVP